MESYANALVVLLNFLFIPALSYGSQLALGALGVTLIYSVLRFSNFAHGETMAFGTMFTILFTWLFQSWGISFGPLPTALLAMPIGIVITIGYLMLTDRFVYRYYRKQKAVPVNFMIASIGVLFLTNGIIRFIIGPSDQIFTDGARFVFTASQFKNWSGLDEAMALRTTSVITVFTALAVMAALFWFLNRTRTGKSMRAYSDNEDLALLSGIDPDKVVRFAWLITAVLATIAGTLYGLDKSFKPFTYQAIVLPIFAAAIVGGVGNPVGAIFGGFLIAFSEIALTFAYTKVIQYTLPEFMHVDGLAQILSTDYKFAVSFIILVVVLLVKPTGLFSGKTI